MNQPPRFIPSTYNLDDFDEPIKKIPIPEKEKIELDKFVKQHQAWKNQLVSEGMSEEMVMEKFQAIINKNELTEEEKKIPFFVINSQFDIPTLRELYKEYCKK
jgi:hypothetical protein